MLTLTAIYDLNMLIIAHTRDFVIKLKAERNVVNTLPTMCWADLKKLAKAHT